MRLNQIVKEAITDPELRKQLRRPVVNESDVDDTIDSALGLNSKSARGAAVSGQRPGAAKASQAAVATGEYNVSNDELEAQLGQPLSDGGDSLALSADDQKAYDKEREMATAEKQRLAKERETADKIKKFSGTIPRLVANALNEKIKGTLARLKANPKNTSEYYDRASVNLRNYVVDIAKRWHAFAGKMVSEAAPAYDLGSIYQALLDYSYKVVEKIVVDNGINRESALKFVDDFKKHNASVVAAKAASGASGQPGERVDYVTWIKRLPEKFVQQFNDDYMKTQGTKLPHGIFRVWNDAPKTYEAGWLKDQVDDVYDFVRRKNAERTMKKNPSKVTAADWLLDFLKKKNAEPWLKRHELWDSVEYFTPFLMATVSDGKQYLRGRTDPKKLSMMSNNDQTELKSLVSDIYKKLAAQRGIA